MISTSRNPDTPNTKRPVVTRFSQWQQTYWFLFMFPVMILLASSISMVTSRISSELVASLAAALACLSTHITAGKVTRRRCFALAELTMVAFFFLGGELLKLSY